MTAASQTDTRRSVALGLLAVTQFMLIADQTVVNIALPSIGPDPGITGVGLSCVVNAYVLTIGGLLPAGRPRDAVFLCEERVAALREHVGGTPYGEVRARAQ
jgi:hypothetical protein